MRKVKDEVAKRTVVADKLRVETSLVKIIETLCQYESAVSVARVRGKWAMTAGKVSVTRERLNGRGGVVDALLTAWVAATKPKPTRKLT